MPLPASIHATVSQSLLGRVTRIFNNSAGDVLSETLQNSRRAGASRVDIDVKEIDDRSILVIRDDGSGIDDPAKILTLGDSGWDADIARREDPAGMGVFSLAGRHVEIRSRSTAADIGWSVVIPPEAWESGTPLAIGPDDIAAGTEIRIDMPEPWIRDLPAAVASAARHYPLPVTFGGEELKREDFLAGACRVEEWQGCRIGVFHDRTHLPAAYPRVNFHGLTVLCPMPGISEVKDGEKWHVRVDIIDAPALQLVLPARKEMVQNAAIEALREAAERAIYRTVALTGGHRLAHAQWQRARELGIDLPEAEPWLSGWIARTADGDGYYLGERIVDMPMILFPDAEAPLEQCAARVLGTGQALGGALVREVSAFEGYDWYDALPRISSLSFRVETSGSSLRYDSEFMLPDTVESGRVDSIQLEVAVSRSRQSKDDPVLHSLAADVLIAPDDSWSADLDQTVILLAPDSTITPNDLAHLLEAACFCAGDDVDNDSWHTQQRDFERRARQIANTLLLGEDAAILERIRDIAFDEIGWLIPEGRRLSMIAGSGKIDLAFVDAGSP